MLWQAEAGAANIGFATQQALLERVLSRLPAGAPVIVVRPVLSLGGAVRLVNRTGLAVSLTPERHNLLVGPGVGDVTTGELARSVTERYLPSVRSFGRGEVMTNIGILQETGHPEPWVIAMECAPTRAAVMDYGSRWAIEPT